MRPHNLMGEQFKNQLWFILFSIVLLFIVNREREYILIYYTIWTFILETIYFGLLCLKYRMIANEIFPIIYAPSIVVCVGFWVIIAPSTDSRAITNIMFTVVTHGLNMVALILQQKKVYMSAIWKPIAYTFLYNVFLAIYVGSGGRSISGSLPYWYAQYDNFLGWLFAFLAISAVTVVHILISSKPIKKIQEEEKKLITV